MLNNSIKTIIINFFFLVLITNAYPSFNYEFKVEIDNQLFPSLITTFQNLNIPTQNQDNFQIGDKTGMIGLEIITNEPLSGRLIIESGTYISRSEISFNIDPSTKTYIVSPVINYNFPKLFRTRQATPEVINFILEIDGKDKILETKKILVRSINDCPFRFKEKNKPVRSFNFIFAAFVNENHPIVDQILGNALNIEPKIVNQFRGYQGSPQEVEREIFAVWNALQREKVHYSSITRGSAYSENVHSQHVRFIQDVYKNKQANCVEGSTLLASIFTKLGLYTELIFPPEHCMLTVYLENPQKVKKPQFICLETTAIGMVDITKLSIDRGINSILSGRNHNLSNKNFNYAIKEGSRKYNLINNWEKDTKVSIFTARRLGIIPIVDPKFN